MANWDTYNRKIKSQGNIMRDRQINLIEDAINNNFQNSMSYKNVTFNNSTTQKGVQILERVKQNEKDILLYPGEILNIGDIIAFDNTIWVCTEVNKTNPIYQSGKIIQSINDLTIIKNNQYLDIPCIISKTSSVWDLDENKFFSLPDNQIYIIIPNNTDTRTIAYNQVFQIGLNKYQVIAINDLVMPNLLVLTMEYTNKELAEIIPTSPTSDINITGSNTIIKSKSATYISDTPCVWSVANDDNSSNNYVTITSETTTQIILNAQTTVGKYITLTATSIEDSELTVDKQIQIVNLF